MTSHKSVSNDVCAARFVTFVFQTKPFGSTRDVLERKGVCFRASMLGTKNKLS